MTDHQNRRSVRGLLVRPRRQLTFAAVIVSFGLAGLVLISVIGTLLIRHTLAVLGEQYNIDDAALHEATAALLASLGLVAGVGALLLAAVFFVLVLISHRVYGPMIALDLHLKKLLRGEYAARVKLRENDEFTEFAASLNELSAGLEARYGSDAR